METLHPPGHLLGKISGQRASLRGSDEVLKSIFTDFLHRQSSPVSFEGHYALPLGRCKWLRSGRTVKFRGLKPETIEHLEPVTIS
jgi:hypothetical protein